MATKDENFARPLLTSPQAGFPRPANVVGWGWGEIITRHHRVGQG